MKVPMRRSTLLKLTVVLAGLGAIGGLGWRLLTSRPFVSAPPLAGATTIPRRSGPGAGELVSTAVQPTEVDLPSPLALTIDRVETPPLTDTVNILLAGVDTRPEQLGGRTDALVLMVLDEKSGHVGLIGIPRDLLVNIGEQRAVRINEVYTRGSRGEGAPAVPASGPAGGRALLAAVIQDAVGLPVHQLVFVNHAGFERLIDQAGGVPVRVICPIRDRFIDPRGPDGHLDLDLEPGSTGWTAAPR